MFCNKTKEAYAIVLIRCERSTRKHWSIELGLLLPGSHRLIIDRKLDVHKWLLTVKMYTEFRLRTCRTLPFRVSSYHLLSNTIHMQQRNALEVILSQVKVSEYQSMFAILKLLVGRCRESGPPYHHVTAWPIYRWWRGWMIARNSVISNMIVEKIN